ncbi:MAG: DUF504 domain-containing protein [Thermoplasmatota archaeon]
MLLNQLKWTGTPMEDVEIWYRHRGAPGDTRVVRGDSIRTLGRSFFDVHDAETGRTGSVPYHRILRILMGSRTIFDRERDAGAKRTGEARPRPRPRGE